MPDLAHLRDTHEWNWPQLARLTHRYGRWLLLPQHRMSSGMYVLGIAGKELERLRKRADAHGLAVSLLVGVVIELRLLPKKP
jgi:hypothetical protein